MGCGGAVSMIYGEVRILEKRGTAHLLFHLFCQIIISIPIARSDDHLVVVCLHVCLKQLRGVYISR